MANYQDIALGRIFRQIASGIITAIIPRSYFSFGEGFTVTDDPANDQTIITTAGGSGGGDLIVANLAALPSNVGGLDDGQRCWVQSVRRAFVLESTSATASSAEDIYATGTEGRFWFGTSDTDSCYWMRQTVWSIDNTGNVEASGDATHPIPEAERRRRMGSDPDWLGQAYHLILADTTAICLEGRTENNCVVYCHASATYGNGLAAGATTGTANTVQALSGNTPWAVTVTAFTDWSGKSLMRYRQTSGANAGSVAWSTLQDGTTHNKSRLTYFTPPPANWTNAPFVLPTVSDTGPANGTTFVLESLPTVRIAIELVPGRITRTDTAPQVVLDSLNATLSGASPSTNVYVYGCNVASSQAAIFARLTLHDCLWGLLLDRSLKTIVGGAQTPPSVNTMLFSPAAPNTTSGHPNGSSIDRLTIQNGVTDAVYLLTIGGPGDFEEGWKIGIVAFYDTSVATLLCESPATFDQMSLVGTGNTGPIIGQANNVVSRESASNKFTAQSVVTSGAAHVRFGAMNTPPGRQAFSAYDDSTGTLLAPQNATFANLDAEMDLNGAVTDLVTNAGFTRTL